MHDLLLDSTKIDSDKINSITLILVQTSTYLFRKYWLNI